jgi:hypothetical protein
MAPLDCLVLLVFIYFRERPNSEGNRQPDHDHVHNQPQNQVMKFVRTPCVQRGERQNDKIHYLFNGIAGSSPAGKPTNSDPAGRPHLSVLHRVAARCTRTAIA